MPLDRDRHWLVKWCSRCRRPYDSLAELCVVCDQPLVALPSDMTVLDARYVIETTLGRGSMGVVFRAWDVDLGRVVALKVILPELAADRDLVSRFRREAQALAAVRNQHVVQVYTSGVHAQTVFFAMEYLEGRNLDEVLAQYVSAGVSVPVPLAVGLLSCLAAGLGAVHDVGIIHRDVKPGNVMIEHGTGRPVLIDFGLSKYAGQHVVRNSLSAGTPEYVAPEQALGEKGAGVSVRTDQYAFGCMAFELLTGHTPYENENTYQLIQHHVHSPPPVVSAIRPDLARFDPVLVRAMAKDPADRYPSMRAFREDLERVTGQPVSTDMRLLTQEPVPASERRPAIRVLVVDTDDAFARLAARAAQIAFFRVAVAISVTHSTAEALASIGRHTPGMLIVGHGPPGLDASTVIESVRRSVGGSDTEVVLAGTDATITLMSQRHGVRSFIRTPTGMGVIAETVQFLARARGWLITEEPSADEDA